MNKQEYLWAWHGGVGNEDDIFGPWPRNEFVDYGEGLREMRNYVTEKDLENEK